MEAQTYKTPYQTRNPVIFSFGEQQNQFEQSSQLLNQFNVSARKVNFVLKLIQKYQGLGNKIDDFRQKQKQKDTSNDINIKSIQEKPKGFSSQKVRSSQRNRQFKQCIEQDTEQQIILKNRLQINNRNHQPNPYKTPIRYFTQQNEINSTNESFEGKIKKQQTSEFMCIGSEKTKAKNDNFLKNQNIPMIQSVVINENHNKVLERKIIQKIDSKKEWVIHQNQNQKNKNLEPIKIKEKEKEEQKLPELQKNDQINCRNILILCIVIFCFLAYIL